MAASAPGGGAVDVAKHYANASKDESGEYRANKYNRTLGSEARADLPALPILNAALPLDELVAHLREHGGAVLRDAIPLADVLAAREEHQRLLSAVTPLFLEMQATGANDGHDEDGDPDEDASFCKSTSCVSSQWHRMATYALNIPIKHHEIPPLNVPD